MPATKPDRRIGAAAGDDIRQPRRNQRIDAVGGKECADRDLEHSGVGANQQPHADRNAGDARQHEGP